MVDSSKVPEEGATPEPAEYTGGVRWRKLMNVSAPAARLTVGATGISIEPSSARLPRVCRLLGVPTLSADWPEVEEVELARGPFSWGRAEGVSFMVDGRRLVFGCEEPVAESVIEDVERFGGGPAVRRRSKPKLVI